MSSAAYDVLGIGNAIVDVLTHADDIFIDTNQLTKGAMALIDAETAERLYARMQPARECSGGSVANTIACLASLGGRGAFIGRVRDDQLGDIFRHDIQSLGVRYQTPAATAGPPTGRCLVLVTPDAQRTMQTSLGASCDLAPGDIDPHLVTAAKVTYLEGYLWDPPAAQQAMLDAAHLARRADRRVALSLSDPFCVERHRDGFRRLITDHVDILFANEQEILSLYQVASLDDAIAAVRGECRIAALTRSERGSVVVASEATYRVAAASVAKVVDTTGAGDAYAAGFLYGLTHDCELADCARLGSIAAAEVISHIGARPQASLAELIAA